ncbi:MAG TPA: cell division protein ZapA [Casimicrobiaceae bacterium]|jgi:cell division protein ZapA|nr:cell division protein ZapA [Casimicrobiaceae bacterium]
MSPPLRPKGEPATAKARAVAPQVTLDVSLLGRDYRIACAESERAELDEAIALLDRRMREIRESGKVGGSERIAVMAALNLAHDLLRARKSGGAPAPADADVEATSSFAIDDAGARRRISAMRASIEEVLGGQDKLF